MFCKFVDWFLIIFFLIFFTGLLFINNYEVSSNYCIEVNSENISRLNNLIEYLNISDIKDIQIIKLSRFNNGSDNYTVELHYDSANHEKKVFKGNINTSAIRYYKNSLKNALDYIKTNGTKSSDFSTYELLVNDDNIDSVLYLIEYLKLDNVSSINKLELTTNNDLYIYYNNTKEEKELIFQHHFEELEIYRNNPIIHAITYIEENGIVENKSSTLNIVISIIIVVIIVSAISSCIKSIINTKNS